MAAEHTLVRVVLSGRLAETLQMRAVDVLCAHGALVRTSQAQVEDHGLLSIDVAIPDAANVPRVAEALSPLAHGEGLHLDVEVLTTTAAAEQVVVSALYAAPMSEGETLRRVLRAVCEQRAHVMGIRPLAIGEEGALELTLCPDHEATGRDGLRALRHALLAGLGADADGLIDLAVQPDTPLRAYPRLLMMDMDSTLIQMECIDELAKLHGVGDEVSKVTARAMAGELDFEESLRHRVATLKGLEWTKAESLLHRIPLMPGAEALIASCKRLGIVTGLVSGGFTFVADRLKAHLGLDYAYANELEVADGKLTGQVVGEVVTPVRKAELLVEIATARGIDLAQTMAVGDGANDLIMLGQSGLGVSFHGKPKVRAEADTAISQGGLDRMLHLLGLSAADIAALVASP